MGNLKNLVAVDSNLPLLRQAQTAASIPENGWLRAVRTAAGLSQGSVAEKISMTRQAYAGLESSEARGAISIASLRRAAEAMDCELVYYIVPREGANEGTSREIAKNSDPDSGQQEAPGHPTMLEEDAASDLPVELK